MEIISHLRLQVPEFTEAPPELSAKWRAGMQAKALEINRQRKKVVKTQRDFQEKIVQPSIKAFATMFNPEFHSRRGLTVNQIIEIHQKQLAQSAPKYFKKLKQMYRTVNGIKAKRYQESVAKEAPGYAAAATRYLLPWTGHRSLGPGVATLATRWLTGDPKVKDDLRPTDKIITGGPVLVTRSAPAGRFRKILRNRLIQWGIKAMGFNDVLTREANRVLNALVQEYTRSELIGFTPGGASHIDLVMGLDPLGEPLKKRLYVDIQVARV